jgi:tetratricopeptide (TPR) repeat protein
MALISKGQVDQAIAQYQKALEIQPRSALFHFNLGVAFAQKGQVDKAIEQYQKAVDLQPDYLQARNNLGDALLRTGRTDEAIAQFQEALKIWPNSTILRNNLGCIFLRQGQVRAAMAHFQRTLEIQPNNVDACQYLAWVLATGPEPSIRNGARAVELAQEANQLSGGGDPEIISTLAAAYAEAGRFPEAVTTARQALQLVVTQNNNAAVNALQTQIGLYQAGLPFRDLSLTNALSSESQP